MNDGKKLRNIILFVVAYLSVAAVMYDAEIRWKSQTFDDEVTTQVLVEDYEKICIGMTYKEVCELMGGEGTKWEEYGNARKGITHYRWRGKFYDGDEMSSYVDVGFENESGRVTRIEENDFIQEEKSLRIKPMTVLGGSQLHILI